MLDSPAIKLRAAREKAGYPTATAAAKAYGWNYSAYVHHENGTRGITTEAAQRYVAAFGRKSGLKISDLLGLGEDVETSVGVIVEGGVEMGVWREVALEELESHTRTLKIPPGRRRRERRALHVLDDSVDKAIAPGEYAIYQPLDEAGDLEELAGQLLYVECRVRKMVERSIRISSMQKDGRLKLTAHSRNLKFNSTMTYPCTQGAVTILGRIVGKYADWDEAYPQKK